MCPRKAHCMYTTKYTETISVSKTACTSSLQPSIQVLTRGTELLASKHTPSKSINFFVEFLVLVDNIFFKKRCIYMLTSLFDLIL